ncbi:MFS transporter [Streptomyces sp. 8N706]|uniref:MFS transporter n=1 Tax=Streptomyces sp. 8N706 TaxID=3457416 RepID=UPI003FD590CF
MRRWIMLALGTAAQTVACVFVYGIPYMSDTLRRDEHLTLAEVGLVVACPTLGLVLALVAWGALADRYGERSVIASGLSASALVLAGASAVHGMVVLGALFALAGACGASVFAASGRLVVGWFPARERGFAMGIRQTSTPLGMAVAALAMPPLAGHWGVRGAVVFTAVLCGLLALLVRVLAADPPRPEPAADTSPSGNPYRNPALWRVHASSALLCVPQFTAGAFALVLLVDLRGWSAVHAGQLLAAAQCLGALSRIIAGRWSDRVGSRLRPMRQLALGIVAMMVLTALGTAWPSPATDIALVVACGITASTNGLAFTATAELAGRAWSGRAMGIQNTGQNLTASITPPLLGGLISLSGYTWGFLVAGAMAAVAAMLIPVPSADRPKTRMGSDDVPAGVGGRVQPRSVAEPPALPRRE